MSVEGGAGPGGPPVPAAPDGDAYTALHEGLASADVGRDVVRVSGPDAERYLQGQLSQDVAALADGSSAWALALQPQGKLDAFCRCSRLERDEFLLDTDAGTGERLVQRLLRFRLRTKADVELLPWRALAVRGRGAAGAANAGPAASVVSALPPGAEATVCVPFRWGPLRGYDLFGPAPRAPAGAVPAGPGAYEAARVEAGFPVHGAELDERTVPAEAGLVEATVSFTKGCYTGQELVARIDSRGNNVPRRLWGLLLSGPAEAGARLFLPSGEAGPGKEVGRLTSVARSPKLGWVALGYAARSVQAGATLAVRGAPGRAEEGEGPPGGPAAEVCSLPLVAAGG